MDIKIILLGLLIISTLAGLVTEAVKKLLNEYGKKCHANMLAGCASLIVSAIVTICYVIITETPWNSQVIVSAIVVMLLSWLCAMVGYDKVVQAIAQIASNEG